MTRTHQEIVQDVFDAVVLHLFTQGKQSFGPTGACAYRGDEGRACAVGALILDEHYDPGLENVGILHPEATHISLLEKRKAARLREALAESIGINPVFSFPVPSHPQQEHLGVLLRHLQAIHDGARPELWPRRLKNLAHQWGLEDKINLSDLPEIR